METSAGYAAEFAFYGVIVCWWAFILTFWLRKRPARVQATRRDPISYLGLLLQAIGYFIVWITPMHDKQFSRVASEPAVVAWTVAVASVGIAAASAALVIWSARRLGKQWSLGAQLVENHDLIQDGPYRFVRNPIYAGMFGMLIATGIPGTALPALLAIVLFTAGTWIRIRIEERLLRAVFGERFDEYARKVPAIIPGIY